MNNIEYKRKIYQDGIILWNRSNIEKAKEHFDYILNELDILDGYEKQKLADFYHRFGEDEKVKRILKELITTDDYTVEAVKKYLKLSSSDLKMEELLYIEKLNRVRLNVEINLTIAKIYRNKRNNVKSYEILTRILDYIENNRTEIDMNLYVEALVEVIKLEYKFENFTQARIQLRKLINASFEYNEKENVVYWAIVLNIFKEVLIKKEWIEVIKNLENKEVKLLAYTLIQIYKNEVNEKLFKMISQTNFEDEHLKYRARVIVIYLKKCTGDVSWKEDIEEIDIKKCYQAILMKYEKEKEKLEFEAEKFLKEYYKYHYDIPQIINTYWNSKPPKKSKELQDVSIQFVGGADSIGGSSILISYKGLNILLDAGANINKDEFVPNFSCMNENGVNIEDLDYVIITHGHLDHTGSLPILYKKNQRMKILATQDTKDIMKIMLEDTVKMNEKKVTNVYNVQDIKNLVSKIKVTEFENEIKISDDVSITLYRAGHILGAASIYLKLGDTKVLYTGDYSVNYQYTVNSMKLPEDLEVDILLTESTYAYQPINFDLDKTRQEELLVEEIVRVTQNGGVVLIPAFAVGRAQEIVLLIKNYFKEELFIPFDLYIDGKVVEICSLYETSEEIKENKKIYGDGVSTVNKRYCHENKLPINKFRGSCVISSSGMLNEGSKSSKYASTIIGDQDSLILFSGYLDEESPGKQLIKELQNEVVPKIYLEGELRKVDCEVKSYKLSAHPKKSEIVELIVKLKPKYTFLVHGEIENRYKFFGNEDTGKEIYPEIESMLKYLQDCKVMKPKNGEIYKLKNL